MGHAQPQDLINHGNKGWRFTGSEAIWQQHCTHSASRKCQQQTLRSFLSVPWLPFFLFIFNMLFLHLFCTCPYSLWSPPSVLYPHCFVSAQGDDRTYSRKYSALDKRDNSNVFIINLTGTLSERRCTATYSILIQTELHKESAANGVFPFHLFV